VSKDSRSYYFLDGRGEQCRVKASDLREAEQVAYQATQFGVASQLTESIADLYRKPRGLLGRLFGR